MNTQEFNFTGKLVPLHYVTHLVDDPPRHSLASFVTSVTGKAEADQTSEDYKATFCDQMHVGLEFLKEVDALQESNKETYSERKFFEMECQFLDFGLSAETGKPEKALHFFFPFNEDPVKGLRGADYFIQTYAHDQLSKNEGGYETLLSFNKTFGSKHKLKIFKSDKLENLEIEEQMFFEFEGETRAEITSEF